MSFFDDNELIFISHYEPSNKIWGWFRSTRKERKPMDLHAFWAVVGKTITVKRHHWRSNMNHVRDKKLAGKYVEISTERLAELWPSFREDLEQQLLFMRLTGELDG